MPNKNQTTKEWEVEAFRKELKELYNKHRMAIICAGGPKIIRLTKKSGDWTAYQAVHKEYLESPDGC